VQELIMPNTIVESTEVRLKQTLRGLGDAKRAEQKKRYQKSRWDHWGVSLPKMDVAIKETLGDLSQAQTLELSRRLWRAAMGPQDRRRADSCTKIDPRGQAAAARSSASNSVALGRRRARRNTSWT
jgi:hypothetical protein